MQEETLPHSSAEKAKKYWSGNIRIFSDFCWSVIISLFLTISGGPRGGIPPLFCFFLFFFWSWNEQHVQKRFARWFIHILCWIFFVFVFLMLVGLFFDKSYKKDFALWCGLTLVTILAIGIAIKYKNLMWPKKSQREVGQK